MNMDFRTFESSRISTPSIIYWPNSGPLSRTKKALLNALVGIAARKRNSTDGRSCDLSVFFSTLQPFAFGLHFSGRRLVFERNFGFPNNGNGTGIRNAQQKDIGFSRAFTTPD
jgi:hypothetical protein